MDLVYELHMIMSINGFDNRGGIHIVIEIRTEKQRMYVQIA